MKFLHTMIRVKDIDASLKFYTEVLNMKLDHKKRLEDCWLYFLTDEENTCQIELTVTTKHLKTDTTLEPDSGILLFQWTRLMPLLQKLQNLVMIIFIHHLI